MTPNDPWLHCFFKQQKHHIHKGYDPDPCKFGALNESKDANEKDGAIMSRSQLFNIALYVAYNVD